MATRNLFTIRLAVVSRNAVILISVGWPHYAHGGSVLSAPCNNVDELRREIQQLKAQLDSALADGEKVFDQLSQ